MRWGSARVVPHAVAVCRRHGHEATACARRTATRARAHCVLPVDGLADCESEHAVGIFFACLRLIRREAYPLVTLRARRQCLCLLLGHCADVVLGRVSKPRRQARLRRPWHVVDRDPRRPWLPPWELLGELVDVPASDCNPWDARWGADFLCLLRRRARPRTAARFRGRRGCSGGA